MARIRFWVRKHIKPGFRWPIGVLMMFLGLFSFLPLIGVWMIPLGMLIAGMDIGPVWQKVRARREAESRDASGT